MYLAKKVLVSSGSSLSGTRCRPVIRQPSMMVSGSWEGVAAGRACDAGLAASAPPAALDPEGIAAEPNRCSASVASVGGSGRRADSGAEPLAGAGAEPFAGALAGGSGAAGAESEGPASPPPSCR